MLAPLGDGDAFTEANSGDRPCNNTHSFNTLRVARAIFAFWTSLRPLTDAKASLSGTRLAKKQISSRQSDSKLSESALDLH